MAQSVVINGSTYNNVPYIEIPKIGGSGDAIFYETSGDNAVAGNVLEDKTFHTSTGPATGNMPNRGAVTGEITDQNFTNGYSIPAGYHNGSGTVNIKSTDKAKIISANIKNGINILGVDGKSTVVDTEISSDYAAESTILYGKKAYVNGNLVTGQYTGVSVTQDQTDNSLTIS